ncbi:MAG: beta-ketoacyl-ACP synthase II [Candidatus Gastranaerophilales bacterium]|nr:beta-ketoacyl-ACP synthase II [Candidatus Gastranaerophilales bacterium]
MTCKPRRVVITGVGAVTPYGVGADLFWDNVKQGKSGIKNISIIDATNHPVKIAGEFTDFNAAQYMDPKEAKRMDRFTQLAMVAADEVCNDAGITADNVNPERFGVFVGSAAGGMETIEKNHHLIINRGPAKCSPFTVPMMIVDIAAGRISIAHNAKGPNKAVVTACATAANSIGDAFRAIQYDDADIMIAGGTEAAITNLGMGGFTSARTLSTRNDEPEKASRPYDKDRDGFVMSEGACLLMLEELEHAKKRGAKIYCEIIGYGASADAYDIVAPHPEGDGAALAMKNAIRTAGIKPEDVNYVNTHGTSTSVGDVAEIKALCKVFGDYVTNGSLFVSSTKSIHGHLLGASGGAEAIVCIKAMQENLVPPTINLENRDEAIPAGINLVPNVAQKTDDLNVTMSNSFGFGGHNASLIFKKYKD